jgi:hypothetical protein
MSKQWSLILAALAITPFSIAKATEQDRDTVVINIASKIRIDKDLEDEFLKEAKADGKMLTKKWATVRGVSEIETTVDRDECCNCKGETVRSESEEEITMSAEVTKCSCGKPITKSCSKCGCKCCSSCSCCCK